MKLRGRDKLALILLLILTALWLSSHLLSVWIAIDWNHGPSSGPTLAELVIHHSSGRVQLIRYPMKFIVDTPPAWLIWDRTVGLEQVVADVMANAEEHEQIEPLPGLIFERGRMLNATPATLATVPYAYPLLLVAFLWTAPYLWRCWRQRRLRNAASADAPAQSPTA